MAIAMVIQMGTGITAMAILETVPTRVMGTGIVELWRQS
jgi:hypothetical protein